jgi:hypothetical protein
VLDDLSKSSSRGRVNFDEMTAQAQASLDQWIRLDAALRMKHREQMVKELEEMDELVARALEDWERGVMGA